MMLLLKIIISSQILTQRTDFRQSQPPVLSSSLLSCSYHQTRRLLCLNISVRPRVLSHHFLFFVCGTTTPWPGFQSFMHSPLPYSTGGAQKLVGYCLVEQKPATCPAKRMSLMTARITIQDNNRASLVSHDRHKT